MKRFPLAVLSAALILLVSACGGGGGGQAQPPAGQGGQNGGQTAPSGGYDAATAQTLYNSKCSSCHGQDLSGAVGPNLTQVGGKYSKDQILDILQNGKGGMPGGLVTGQDAETVAAWLADKK
ncbi:cytochrome c [Brevibacillus composti]|uniref:Cytochrome c n=1 Tax=Brevibacillus composti TaxID=2796470 RepID=A0A7T5EK82_9BACL|nr:cytochrome c [Brevibacillus composti]QQE74088.1 cytochrome c [Brevibacillus composti]QUO41172.1 cytochrome c [Brevibacillus composti]